MAPNTQARIAGSGYTYFLYSGNAIAFCDQVADSGEDLVNPTPDRVHPIHTAFPVEIVSCEATNGGQLTLTIRELWESEVWGQLDPSLAPYITIRDLVNRPEVTVQKIIKAPDGTTRGKTYHGCRITAAQTGETINIGLITIPKTVTITYTNTTPI